MTLPTAAATTTRRSSLRDTFGAGMGLSSPDVGFGFTASCRARRELAGRLRYHGPVGARAPGGAPHRPGGRPTLLHPVSPPCAGPPSGCGLEMDAEVVRCAKDSPKRPPGSRGGASLPGGAGGPPAARSPGRPPAGLTAGRWPLERGARGAAPVGPVRGAPVARAERPREARPPRRGPEALAPGATVERSSPRSAPGRGRPDRLRGRAREAQLRPGHLVHGHRRGAAVDRELDRL